MQGGLTDRTAKDFDFRQRLALEALDEDEIAGRHLAQQIGERGLGRVSELVHDDPAARRRHDHLGRARLAVLVRILARLIDVERVVGVLDRRDLESTLREHG